MTKILTMDALCEYFEKKGKDIHFNADAAQRELVVKTTGRMKFEELNDEELLKVVLQSCHVGKNLNGSSISYEAMQNALPSFYSRPILGYIHEVDGKYEFKSHEMHRDENGEIVYEEIPVGVITSKEGVIEHDYEKNKDYAVVSGVIWEKYTKAAEILKRDKKADCSVELKLNDLSYDAKERTLIINSFIFTGVTILGKDENGRDVEPGMSGANISIEEQFASSDGESVPTELSDNKNPEERRTTEMAKDLPKGTEEVAPEKIDQINKFDGEGTSDASDNGFGDDASSNDENVDNDDPINDQSDVSNQDEGGDQEESGADNESVAEEPDVNSNKEEAEPIVEPEPEPIMLEPIAAAPLATSVPAASSATSVEESSSEEENSSDGDEKKKKVFSVQVEDKIFELSLTQKAWAIEDLVNATYSEEDNDYYMCEVYESHVIMKPWCNSQCYKQRYVEVEENVFSLVGEREKVFAEYLTEAERDALNMMRSTYTELKQYKEQAELQKIESEKDDVFASFDEKLKDNLEYIALKSDRNKYSAAELELQCNAIVGKEAMQYAAKSEDSQQRDMIKVSFASDSVREKAKPYGSLFDK